VEWGNRFQTRLDLFRNKKSIPVALINSGERHMIHYQLVYFVLSSFSEEGEDERHLIEFYAADDAAALEIGSEMIKKKHRGKHVTNHLLKRIHLSEIS
jgi:hypothetical protein